MKKKVIVTISWLLVIIWMAIIFMFSNQNSETSLGGSRKIIKNAVESGNRIFEEIEERKEKADRKPYIWKTNEIEELTTMVDEPILISENDDILKRMEEIEQEIQKLQEEYNSLQEKLGKDRR